MSFLFYVIFLQAVGHLIPIFLIPTQLLMKIKGVFFGIDPTQVITNI